MKTCAVCSKKIETPKYMMIPTDYKGKWITESVYLHLQCWRGK